MHKPAWLPDDFNHPVHVTIDDGHHLRPIRASDAEIDLPAVMGSRERLYQTYGPVWGWPPASMTLEQDRDDLAHHEHEIAAHLSFNYALLDTAETQLLGCVYIDPATRAGFDAECSWWVSSDAAGTPLEHTVNAFVPRWLKDAWPFVHPVLLGVDMSWQDYLTLPHI